MKQATQNKPVRRPLAINMGHRLREGVFILSIAMMIFLYISFASFHLTDPGWSSTGVDNKVLNWGGRAGAFLGDVFLSLLGCTAYLFPPLIVLASWLGVRNKPEQHQFGWLDFFIKSMGFILIVVSGCGLIAIYFKQSMPSLPAHTGGILGDLVGFGLTHVFNVMGSSLFLITAILCGITLFTGFSWLGLVDAIGWQVLRAVSLLRWKKTAKASTPEKPTQESTAEKVEPKIKKTFTPRLEPKVVVQQPEPKPKLKLVPKKTESAVVIAPGCLPPLSLLDPIPQAEGRAFSSVSFEELSLLVEQRLLDFGVEVKVVAVHPGPIITRFELELAPGIKVSKISGLAKDIARSLSAMSVRIVEVIPGKSVIGLELPNEHREVVCLRDILE
ncbi:MAG: DNA translocase FtsK 4TM domain-containing protein, partial [Legionellales bacterium]